MAEGDKNFDVSVGQMLRGKAYISNSFQYVFTLEVAWYTEHIHPRLVKI